MGISTKFMSIKVSLEIFFFFRVTAHPSIDFKTKQWSYLKLKITLDRPLEMWQSQAYLSFKVLTMVWNDE